MVYLNNAATHHPLPGAVVEAVRLGLVEPPVNTHRETGGGEDHLLECRTLLARLFGVADPTRVILTANATEALNLAINGLLKGTGGHVITTQTEHNAVLRPLYGRQRAGDIRLTIVPANPQGAMDPAAIAAALRPDTRLVVANHASNVTGRVLDVDGLYGLCYRRYGVPLLIDASQSAGAVPIDLGTMPGAALAFTGHKGLMGPPGTGGLLVGSSLDLEPWKLGGIGIHSVDEAMPDLWPLRFEPGTPNVPAFRGLAAALRGLDDEGLAPRAERRRSLTEQLMAFLQSQPGCALYSPDAADNPCGTVSLRLAGWACADVGYVLKESFGIHVRTGLHCAPLIHHALGTFPEGTVRISLSSSNTAADIEAIIEALATLQAMGQP